ncbi:MAG TPA: sulfatase [Candidatus Hydrogenedentes bacterium]|nr:sulfatase [Candidatus Hydrogenedentota bacterium]HPG66729.1 sulfatase [Candidatus Hydrogenedentota bacterium]
MTRRRLGRWAAIWALAAFAFGVTEAESARGIPPASPRPNIVVILVDTLRADVLGAYGSSLGATPELDQWARNGLRFERVIAQNSWTRPSIGSLLTSCYPRTIGIYREPDERLPDTFVTLAEALKAVGYKTIGVHSNPNLNVFFNFQQGFDEYIDSEIWYGFMRPKPGQKTFKKSRLASANQLFEKALELAESKGEAPCYLQLVLMDVHEWYRGEYCLTRDEFEGLFPGNPNRQYLAPVRQVSIDINAFAEKLIARPGWENTLFILISDHGEGLDNHPDVAKSRWHGRLLYESQVVVPQIWWNPSWKDVNVVVKRPVRLMDFMPTLLDYVQAPIPEAAQGTSVLPLVADEAAAVALPEFFVVETELRGHDKCGVYSRDWKYFETYDGHPGTEPRELQAMGIAENGSKTNQIAAHPDVADAMLAFLEQWKSRHPKAPPSLSATGMSQDTVEQLKAAGYLE